MHACGACGVCVHACRMGGGSLYSVDRRCFIHAIHALACTPTRTPAHTHARTRACMHGTHGMVGEDTVAVGEDPLSLAHRRPIPRACVCVWCVRCLRASNGGSQCGACTACGACVHVCVRSHLCGCQHPMAGAMATATGAAPWDDLLRHSTYHNNVYTAMMPNMTGAMATAAGIVSSLRISRLARLNRA